MFSVFKYRNYLLLWLGMATSRLGNSLVHVTGYWLLWEMTESSWVLGLASALATATALAGLLTGVLADRMDRKAVMFRSDLIHAALMLLIPALALFDRLHWTAVIAVFALSGLVSQFFMPAQQSVLPDTVPSSQLARASGLAFVTEQGAMVCGALLAGLLIIPFGPVWAYGINTVTFLLSAGCIAGLRVKRSAVEAMTKEPGSIAADLRAVWVYVGRTPFLAVSLPIVIFLFFAFSPVMVLLPQWADQVLQVGPQGYGLLQVAYPAGMAAGGLLAPLADGRMQPRLALALGVFGAAAGLAAFTASRSLVLSVLTIAVMGACLAAANVLFITLKRRIVTADMRGRYFASTQSLMTVSLSAGFLVSGVLADRLGVMTLFAGASLCFVLAGVVVLTAPAFGAQLQDITVQAEDKVG